MNDFSGTGVAVITPFTPDREMDTNALRRILRHLMDGQVEYLVALGTTAESATLSEAEQLKVLDIFFDEAGNKLPIVVGAGGNNTAKVCKWVQTVEERFAPAAFLAVCPYYNKPSQEGLYQHFHAIASSTEKEIILYNVPGRTASNLSATTCLRLAREFPHIRAVKEASGNLEQMMEIVKGKPDHFQLLSGDDLLSLPIISLGGRGTISVIANAYPLPFSNMIRAALAGNWQEAKRLHYDLMKLTQLIFDEGNPTGVKFLMNQLQLCETPVRLPLVEASESLQTDIRTALQQFPQSISV
ncbi:MAG: 4-hydroxy-tetrahydrodipicolinate synthase [Bacteroidota bacterium]